VREQLEALVPFQPDVYTGRIKIKGKPKRDQCLICTLELLLRQVFLENLGHGKEVEKEAVHYLSLYPAYFFAPETLGVVRRAYDQLSHIFFRDSDFRRALISQDDLTDAKFWQRLDPFLLREWEHRSSHVLRYGQQ